MGTLDERVTTLEATMAHQTRDMQTIQGALLHFEERVDRRFEAVDGRFNAMDQRLTAMDQKLDAHFIAIDTKMSRLQSLQVGTLLAVIAALAGMLSGLPR